MRWDKLCRAGRERLTMTCYHTAVLGFGLPVFQRCSALGPWVFACATLSLLGCAGEGPVLVPSGNTPLGCHHQILIWKAKGSADISACPYV